MPKFSFYIREGTQESKVEARRPRNIVAFNRYPVDQEISHMGTQLIEVSVGVQLGVENLAMQTCLFSNG